MSISLNGIKSEEVDFISIPTSFHEMMSPHFPENFEPSSPEFNEPDCNYDSGYELFATPTPPKRNRSKITKCNIRSELCKILCEGDSPELKNSLNLEWNNKFSIQKVDQMILLQGRSPDTCFKGAGGSAVWYHPEIKETKKIKIDSLEIKDDFSIHFERGSVILKFKDLLKQSTIRKIPSSFHVYDIGNANITIEGKEIDNVLLKLVLVKIYELEHITKSDLKTLYSKLNQLELPINRFMPVLNVF